MAPPPLAIASHLQYSAFPRMSIPWLHPSFTSASSDPVELSITIKPTQQSKHHPTSTPELARQSQPLPGKRAEAGHGAAYDSRIPGERQQADLSVRPNRLDHADEPGHRTPRRAALQDVAAVRKPIGRPKVVGLEEAHSLLSPLLGSAIAPTLFGIALLCCGLISTVTATLAGQAVMEGFLGHWPADLVAHARHPHGGHRACRRRDNLVWRERHRPLLILSQVVLSLQLSSP